LNRGLLVGSLEGYPAALRGKIDDLLHDGRTLCTARMEGGIPAEQIYTKWTLLCINEEKELLVYRSIRL